MTTYSRNMDYTTRVLSQQPWDASKIVITDADRPERHVSLGDYTSYVKRISVGLKASGFKEQECMSLISHNDIIYYILAGGCLAAGGVFAPLAPLMFESLQLESSAERLAEYLRVAGTTWLVVTAENLEVSLLAARKLDLPAARVLLFDPPGMETSTTSQPRFSDLLKADETQWHNTNADKDPASIVALRMFTSGTSGTGVKAADITHANLVARIDAQDFVPAATDKSQLHYIYLAATSGQMICQRAFAGGVPVYLSRFDDGLSVLDNIKKHNISVVQMPPRTMEEIAQAIERGVRPKEYLDSLSTIIVGGAASRQEGVELFASFLPSSVLLRSGAGSTEAGIHAMTAASPERFWSDGPCNQIGFPPVGTELRIIDEKTLQPLPTDTEGEICIRSACVFARYVNNSKATNAAFLDAEDGLHWYRTGDRGCIDSATGELVLAGRFNEMFTVSHADRIVPTEVEAALMGHSAVEDAAVTSTPAREVQGHNECLAYVVKRNDAPSVSAAELYAFVASRISAAKAPTGGVIFCESIPRNANKKIVRNRLADVSELPGSQRYIEFAAA